MFSRRVVTDGVDKMRRATEEVAEDPRMRPATEEVAEDPRLRPVPGVHGGPALPPAGGWAALGGTGLPPAGYSLAPPVMQVMAPQFAFGQQNELVMQPMMQPMMQPFMASPFMGSMSQQMMPPPYGASSHHRHGKSRSKSPAARARGQARLERFRAANGNAKPLPARDVRPVNEQREIPRWQPVPKDLLPTRREDARQRAWDRPDAPLPYNRFPARDVRPAPVQRPDPMPRLQLSSDEEVVKAAARIRQQGIDAKKQRVEAKEAKEAAQREMKQGSCCSP